MKGSRTENAMRMQVGSEQRAAPRRHRVCKEMVVKRKSGPETCRKSTCRFWKLSIFKQLCATRSQGDINRPPVLL